jgi:mono/diheme cytochrome c family protein
MRARCWPIGAAAATGLIATAFAGPSQDYMLYCMGCHGADAQGVPGKVPPLARSLGDYMRTAAGRNYVLRVPGAASSVLSDAQLAGVLNWVAMRFSAAQLPGDVSWFTTEEVAQARHTPLADVLATRREIVRSLAASGDAPGLDY